MAGGVSNALAKNEQERKPALELRDQIEKAQPEFARALPAHVSPEHFVRTALTLLSRVPKIAECEPRSVVLGLLDAARLGLEISDVRGQAYLIPRGTRVKQGNQWVDGPKVASFQLGYRGCIDLAARNGITVSATEIRELDQYDVERGTSPRLVHRPPLGHRGKVIAYYAVATMADGRTQFEVMTVAEVEEHRDKFASQRNFKTKEIEGPWVDNFDSMARKTLITKVLNYLPQAIEVRRAMSIETFSADDAPSLPPARAHVGDLSHSSAGELPPGSDEDEPSGSDEDEPSDDPPALPPAPAAAPVETTATDEPPPPPPPEGTTAAPPANRARVGSRAPTQQKQAALAQYGDVVDNIDGDQPATPAPTPQRAFTPKEQFAKIAGEHAVANDADRNGACSAVLGETVADWKKLNEDQLARVIVEFQQLGEGEPFFGPDEPDEPADVAPTEAAPVAAPAPGGGESPENWDKARWRDELGKAGVKASAFTEQLRTVSQGRVSTLDGIAGSGLGNDMYGWLEDNADPNAGGR